MLILCFVIMVILPYLLGGINTAIIVTKIKSGEDIRKLGSGNAGLTNTLRTQGKVAAAFVLLGDVAKGVVSVLLVRLCFYLLAGVDTADFNSSLNWVGYAAGFFAIIGHVYPVYFGFKGGKGVLVTVSTLFAVEPVSAAILLGIFLIIVAFSRYVSLGSCIAAFLYPFSTFIFCYFIDGDPSYIINTGISVLIAALLIFMHRANLVRLKNGTEKKLGQKETKKAE